MMDLGKSTIFDTDLFIHSLSSDPPVRSAARDKFNKNRPSCACSFTFVELKGNILQDYILLHKKISDSSSFVVAANRILKSSGRRVHRMFSALIKMLGGLDFPVKDWEPSQNQMLVALDSQIANLWLVLHNKVDFIVDDIRCTRATEEPIETNGKWKAIMHKCNIENTTCNVVGYFEEKRPFLESLVEHMKGPTVNMTGELNKINKVAKKITEGQQYEWQGYACREIGDLLIALHSIGLSKLISSNKNEHIVLSQGLGYNFEEFPIVSIRS